jgi:hypothetical protein
MTKSARQLVQRELAAETPAVSEAMIAAVRSQIPAYRQLHPTQTAEVAAIATWALNRILGLWVDGGPLDAHDLARFRAIGAARARDGRPLTAVLRAYRVAAGHAIDAVVRYGRGRLSTDDIVALTRLWLASVDELSEALFEGYHSAAEHLSGDRERALRELADDVLVGRQTSTGALADRFAQLDVSLPERPYLLLADHADPAVALTEADGRALVATLGVTRFLVTTRGRRLALLMPPVQSLGPAVAARGWRGCLIVRYPLVDMPTAYRLAADALDSSPPYAHDGRPVLDDGDAQVLALLAARGTARPDEVVTSVLGALADPRNRHLLDGLDAYLTTGSATAAAGHLHLHPQTLRYRLRRVREITGRDPRLPWQRLALDVARHLVHVRRP